MDLEFTEIHLITPTNVLLEKEKKEILDLYNVTFNSLFSGTTISSEDLLYIKKIKCTELEKDLSKSMTSLRIFIKKDNIIQLTSFALVECNINVNNSNLDDLESKNIVKYLSFLNIENSRIQLTFLNLLISTFGMDKNINLCEIIHSSQITNFFMESHFKKEIKSCSVSVTEALPNIINIPPIFNDGWIQITYPHTFISDYQYDESDDIFRIIN